MKWKRILGCCILFSPLIAIAGALVWEGGVIHMLVHFALVFALIAAVVAWVVAAGALLTDSSLTVDDVKNVIYDELADLLRA